MHYTANPDSGLFQVSEPGTVSVSDAGATTFAAGGGAVRRITADPSKRAETLAAFVEIVSTKPPPPPAPRGRGAA